jgi:fatty acid desaturase
VNETLTVILISLSSYRLTRLFARDSFPPIAVRRARIAERRGDASWQAYLATCSWCLGVWIAALVTGATWWAVGVPLPPLTWGAAAAVTGFLAEKE